jgi:hypothetical protein
MVRQIWRGILETKGISEQEKERNKCNEEKRGCSRCPEAGVPNLLNLKCQGGGFKTK